MQTTQSPFIAKLKQLIAAKHLLQHPFYQHWNQGTLPLPVMQKYAEQYYHLEKNFPRFLSRMHANCEEFSVRQTITDNLYDEEHGEANHRELWLRFGEAIGCARANIQAAAPLPETAATIVCFNALSAESLLHGAAALATYESQLAAVAKTKIDGLKTHYGLTSERATTFFRVHSTLDVAHSNAWWNIIAEQATPADEEKIISAVVKARDALWNFLDGVCRAYFPAALVTC